jgi:hypothetical protein
VRQPRRRCLRLPEGFRANRPDADGAHVSYSFASGYKARVPETGKEVRKLLSAPANLHQADVSIDWDQVKRVAAIDSAKWTTSRDRYGRLARTWNWPEGVLELSTRAGANRCSGLFASSTCR